MDADNTDDIRTPTRLTRSLIGAAFTVHNELGFGFLESIYRDALAAVLEDTGVRFRREVPAVVQFRGRKLARFSLDFLVEESVIIETKAKPTLEPKDDVQLLNYLRATDFELGMLINFGHRVTFKRLVFSNSRKVRP